MKLIDKDAVVAWIRNRLLPTVNSCADEWERGEDNERINILNFINSLEVKGIDLDDDKKESLAQDYIDYTFKRHNIDPDSKEGQLIYYAYIHGINACLKELRTQKEE